MSYFPRVNMLIEVLQKMGFCRIKQRITKSSSSQDGACSNGNIEPTSSGIAVVNCSPGPDRVSVPETFALSADAVLSNQPIEQLPSTPWSQAECSTRNIDHTVNDNHSVGCILDNQGFQRCHAWAKQKSGYSKFDGKVAKKVANSSYKQDALTFDNCF
uniref:Uncharacterized protein n=1 Tax=Spongospora subterranea TaxID=70186 RepID=A0A0H5R7Q0_9EUKA|eukprot:CRZ04279.1 hypothetical protein [Spongospora subterranea]